MASSAAITLVLGLQDKASKGLDGIADRLGKVGKVAAGLAAGGILAVGAGLGKAAMEGLQFNNTLQQAEARLNAFTGDADETAKILEMVQERAARTPFAFSELASAAASLGPVSRTSGVALEDLISQAEILAASNPAQGFEGAVIALKEATGGDFMSIVERFDLPRQRLNELKAQGVPAAEAVKIAMSEMGLNADLVSNMAETASGRWGTLVDTFTTLAGTATKSLFDGVSEGMGGLQTALDENMPALEAFATTIGEKLGTALSWLATTAIPAVTGAFSALSTAFNEGGLAGVVDLILPKLQEFGSSILTWIIEQAPKWAAQLVTWGEQFIAWVAPYIPPLLEKLGEFAAAAWTWIGEKAPVFLEKLGAWGVELIGWILPKIPALLENLGRFIGNIVIWIGEQMPAIQASVKAWGEAFTKWVNEVAVPGLAPAFATFDTEMGRLMDEMQLKVGDAGEATGKELARRIGIAMDEELPHFRDVTLDAWSQSIFTWLDETAPEVLPKAKEIGQAIIDGIKEKQKEWLPALDRWAAALSTWASETAIKVTGWVMGIGIAIVDGVIKGIVSAAGRLITAATGAVTDALDAAKRLLGIDSPSKVARDELGIPFVDGIIVGLVSQWRQLDSTLLSSINRTIASAGDAITGGFAKIGPLFDAQKPNANFTNEGLLKAITPLEPAGDAGKFTAERFMESYHQTQAQLIPDAIQKTTDWWQTIRRDAVRPALFALSEQTYFGGQTAIDSLGNGLVSGLGVIDGVVSSINASLAMIEREIVVNIRANVDPALGGTTATSMAQPARLAPNLTNSTTNTNSHTWQVTIVNPKNAQDVENGLQNFAASLGLAL